MSTARTGCTCSARAQPFTCAGGATRWARCCCPRCSFDAEVELQQQAPQSFYLVSTQLRGQAQVDAGHCGGSGGAGLVMVDSATCGVVKRFSADSQRLHVRLSRDEVAGTCAQLLGRPLPRPPEFEPLMPAGSGAARRWLALTPAADRLRRGAAATAAGAAPAPAAGGAGGADAADRTPPHLQRRPGEPGAAAGAAPCAPGRGIADPRPCRRALDAGRGGAGRGREPAHAERGLPGLRRLLADALAACPAARRRPCRPGGGRWQRGRCRAALGLRPLRALCGDLRAPVRPEPSQTLRGR